MAKVSKFQQQLKAKQTQIENIIKSVVPVDSATLSAHEGKPCLSYLTVHGWKDKEIVLSVFNWDDTGDNRQKIRESYDEYLAKQ